MYHILKGIKHVSWKWTFLFQVQTTTWQPQVFYCTITNMFVKNIVWLKDLPFITHAWNKKCFYFIHFGNNMSVINTTAFTLKKENILFCVIHTLQYLFLNDIYRFKLTLWSTVWDLKDEIQLKLISMFMVVREGQI